MQQPKLLTLALLTLTLVSCASTHSSRQVVPVSKFASKSLPANQAEQEQITSERSSEKPVFSQLEVFRPRSSKPLARTDLANNFSNSKRVSFSADAMPLKDLLHAVLTEVLAVNYVIAADINNLDEPVTLNIGQDIPQRRAFQLLAELLQQRSIALTENEGVYYLHTINANRPEGIASIGREPAAVPQTSSTILQIVPLRYGNNTALERTLREFIGIKVDADLNNNALFLSGNRADIIRALDLVNLLDVPLNRGRNLALIRLTYLTADDFAKQVADLLKAEGIRDVVIGANNGSILLLPVEHIGAVVAFSAEQPLLQRVQYWARQLDIPSEGPEKRYFIYNPRYARAADLGESLTALIAPGSGRQGNQSRDTATAMGQQADTAANSSGSSRRSASGGGSQATSVQGENISLTIDERSNSLVFFTTGSEYQALLPMIRRLDIMPKQVLLEATIAEVTLSNEFEMGVEFAIKNGSFGYGTSGAFGVADMGGFSLSYLKGAEQLVAKLRQGNSLINVLSNPSVVVRDGVSASISVGDDIPTVSSTTSDPILGDRQVNNVSYRKTGLEFTVTPTINAQGLVVMEIDQRISSTVDGSTVPGAPAIFQRSLQTEVIAENGQTIMLGGLISENSSRNNTQVPGFANLPLLGHLFKSTTNKSSKTELILLITPRVIDSADQWHYINQQIKLGFDHLELSY